MPDTKLPISFQLPDRSSIDAYVVKTADGRVLIRTAGELAPAPKQS
jgi:hypothetical protein